MKMETLKKLTIYRDMLKTLIEHLAFKARAIENMLDKTPKDIAEISVKIFKARHGLYCVQYQINKLITTSENN